MRAVRIRDQLIRDGIKPAIASCVEQLLRSRAKLMLDPRYGEPIAFGAHECSRPLGKDIFKPRDVG
jgi:hypothetical protein